MSVPLLLAGWSRRCALGEATPEDVGRAPQSPALEDRDGWVSYSYNEPLASWEFVRDYGMLVNEAAMSTCWYQRDACMEEVVQRSRVIDEQISTLVLIRRDPTRCLGGKVVPACRTHPVLAQTPTCHLG
jgi:hypothetical protein